MWRGIIGLVDRIAPLGSGIEYEHFMGRTPNAIVPIQGRCRSLEYPNILVGLKLGQIRYRIDYWHPDRLLNHFKCLGISAMTVTPRLR